MCKKEKIPYLVEKNISACYNGLVSKLSTLFIIKIHSHGRIDMKKRIFGILSEFEREVLRLYLGGFSYRSIGEKLGKTEKSVGNALSRIRKKLRTEINPEK